MNAITDGWETFPDETKVDSDLRDAYRRAQTRLEVWARERPVINPLIQALINHFPEEALRLSFSDALDISLSGKKDDLLWLLRRLRSNGWSTTMPGMEHGQTQ